MAQKALKSLIESVSRLNSCRPGVQKQNDRSHNTKGNATKDENKRKNSTKNKSQNPALNPKTWTPSSKIINQSAQKAAFTSLTQVNRL